MKKCTQCNLSKSTDNFYKDKQKKDNLTSKCKNCIKQNRLENIEKISFREKLYYDNNKDKILSYQLEYHNKNRDIILEKQKRRYKINKENRLSYNKAYINKRYKEDNLFRFKEKVRSLIFISFKNKSINKTSNTFEILGCNYEEFKSYLENNNYNFKVSDKDMDLDHIVPISSAKNIDELLKLNHYTNFQLLPSDYNRWIKRCNLFDKEHFENWLNNKECVEK